jgi:Zn-dependent protease/CBS domain-containing protein
MATGSRGGVQLLRIAGIQIGFDYSWLFIVVLMTWSLTSAFGTWHADWTAWTSLATAFVAAMLFFASVVLHELAHSLVARRFGVPVKSITLFLFGGISDIEHEPPSPVAEFWTAIVGPLTSIALGLIFLYLAALTTHGTSTDSTLGLASSTSPAETLLLWLGPINILVGIFNLIPGFPLDGGRILRSALWSATRDLRAATRWSAAIGQAIGWVLVFLGVAIAFGAHVPFLGRGVVGGLWLAFIGWFLSSAAAQTWQRQIIHDILRGIPVARLLRLVGATVPPETSVADLVDHWLLSSEERAFPVVGSDGSLRGIVTFADVRRVPRSAWPTTPIRDVMTPVERVVTATQHEDSADALEKLARLEVSQLPVVDSGRRIVGMLRLRDIHRFLELHTRDGAPRCVARG